MLSAVNLPDFSSISNIVGNIASQQGYPAGNPSSGSSLLPGFNIGDLMTNTADSIVAAAAAEAEAQKKKKNAWKWWALGIGGVAIVGGGIYFATRKKRRR